MPQPASLADMFSGKAPLEFNPRDYAGNQIGMGDAIAQNSNSLVGLGMGLLQPYRPGESPYGAALQGFQTGSVADANRGYRTAQLQHQKAQDARQAAQFGAQQARQAREDAYRREQDALNRDLQERQFARTGESSFAKIARDLDLKPGTPEYADQARKYVQSQMEGEWESKDIIDPGDPDGERKITVQQNKRTGQYRRPELPGTGTTAAPADPFTAGVGQPVYGVDGNYSTTPGVAVAAPAQPAAAPLGGGIPPAPPGADRKEWKKEQTKLEVQRRALADANKKAGASIDPVTEDIDRALAQIEKYPGMTTGAFSGILKKIPLVGGATQAGEVESLIKTVKANASFDKLSQLKANSPSGASGLGAVTQGEHQMMQDAIGSLEQSQDAQSVLYNLERIKRIRHEIMHGPGTAPPPRFKPPSYQQTPGAPTTAAGRPLAPSAGGVRRYNPETGKIE